MKNLLFIALMFALFFFATACDEDSFTQVVEVEIPSHESSIVMNALFSNLDTSLQLLVSNSLGILDPATHSSMSNASVRLYQDNSLYQEFQFNNQNYRFETNLVQPLSGSIYRIEVDAPNYKSIAAEQEMPAAVELLEVELRDDGAISGDGDRVDEILVKWNDPGHQENYYAIQGFLEQGYFDPQMNDTIYYRSKFYMESFDQVIQFGDQYDILVRDAAFNGRDYNLRLFTYFNLPFGSEQARVVIQLVSLTKDAYLYDRSLNQYYNAVDNPFAEPVVVHNNVEQGYGIFALAVIDEVIVELK